MRLFFPVLCSVLLTAPLASTRADAAPKKTPIAPKAKAASTRAPQKVTKVAISKWRVRVAGRVLDSDDKPVRDARVFLITDGFGEGETLGETRSDAFGAFSLEVKVAIPAASGNSMLSHTLAVAAVQASGFALAGACVKRPESEIKTGEVLESVETIVKLREARVVSGVLRDDKGKTVSGVTLRAAYFYVPDRRGSNIVSIPAELKAQFTARTDAKGAWRIEGLADNAYVGVRLDDERYVPSEVQLGPNGPTSWPSGALVAQRGGEIVGRVLDFNGKPAANVHFTAVPKNGHPNYRNTLLPSAADGTFRLSRLAPGEYSLLMLGSRKAAPPAGFVNVAPPRAEDAWLSPAIEKVQVMSGASTRIRDVKLVRPAIIEGQIVEAQTGKPLAKAVTVQSYGPHWPRAMASIYGGGRAGASDNKGRFSIAVAPGAVRVFAGSPLGEYRETEAAARGEKQFGVSLKLKSGERRRITLRFDRGQTLRGSVRDESGKPVPSVNLIFGKPNGIGTRGGTDKIGDFSLEGLEAVEYRIGIRNDDSETEWDIVGATGDDFYGSSAVSATLPQKEPLKLVVRPRVYAALQGRVLAASGEPLAKAQVRFRVPVQANGSYSFMTATSNAEGRFTLERLRPQFAPPLLQDTTKADYRLRSGGEVTKNGAAFVISDIVMERLSGKVAGRVLAGGQPIKGALVFSPDAENEAIPAVTDDAGRFTLSNLPSSGGAVMAAFGRGFGQANFTAPVGDAAPEIEITLRETPPIAQRDVARAVAIARDIVGSVQTRYEITPLLRRLSLLDPDAAVQIAARTSENPTDTNAATQRVLAIITQRLENDPNADAPRAIEWANARFDTIADDAAFVSGAARLGLALANSAANAPRAASLFERALARQNKRGGATQLESGALLAALAARLKRSEAERLFDAVFVAASQPENAGSWPQVAPNVARGSASMARDALAQMPESQRTSALGAVIPLVATHDMEAARAMFSELERRTKEESEAASTREAKDASQQVLANTARSLIRVVGPRDAAFAASLARSIKDVNLWTSVPVLALAARYQPHDEALAMLREVANGDQANSMLATMPMLAALAVPLDRETANEFLERAWKAVEESGRRGGERYGVENYATVLSNFDPARARMVLESEWAQKKARLAKQAAAQKNGNAPANEMLDSGMNAWLLSVTASAMAPFDFDRALEIARSLDDAKGARSQALTRLALYALGNDDERRFAFSDLDGIRFDD